MKPSIKSLLPAAITAAAVLTPSAASAVDIVMETDPVINGDSVLNGHEGDIDVVSWGWGLSNASTYDSGGFQQGNTSVQSVSVVKNLDSASPELYKRILDASTLTSATIFVKADCGGLYDQMKILMTGPAVTSNSIGFGTDLDGAPTESMTFIYSKICIAVTVVDNVCKTSTTSTTYDVVANKVSTGTSCP